MLQKLLSPKWLVALNVVLISLVSVTLVSAHGGNMALIHACVNNTSGEIKIVGANSNCPSNYRALDWNIQGPTGQQGAQGQQGPIGLVGPVGPIGPVGPVGSQGLQGERGLQGEQGPQGLPGQQGIQGLQGPAGISGWEVVTVRSDNTGGEALNSIGVYVDCPAGKKVLGGGYSMTIGSLVGFSTAFNAPVGPSTWYVGLVRNDLTPTYWTVDAYAICANVAP